MATKKVPESFQTKESPRDSYATRVFKESSVGFVSSVATITNLKRRVFKITAFLFCLTGFLYQSGKFLEGFFQYPTSVDIDIVRPDRYNVPAYTFCDNNPINRRMFCEKYPDSCEIPSEAFCEKYPFYCAEDSETLVPKYEYYRRVSDFSMEQLKDLNVKKSEFVKLELSPSNFSLNITGPYWRVSEKELPGSLCYSLNDRVNNALPPRDTSKNELFRTPIDILRFYVRPEETFYPESRPGILFAIHSQFEAVHPFETGIFMKPGRTYMVFVSMDEEILLKEPYDTNCINYTEKWEKNGYSGPRQQEMCKQECFAEISMACYNCVAPIFRFPTKHRFCSWDDLSVTNKNCEKFEDVSKLVEACNLKCRDDCRRTKYNFNAQERFTIMRITTEEERANLTLDNIIRVEIYLEEDELIVLKHSPKYMVVEVFSNIGGFIGIWLGINLLDIAEIFENFFRIIIYTLKRR